MSERYPSEGELSQVKGWDTTKGDWHEFMDYVEEIWWMPDWGWNREGDIYHVSTGGWSGNEEIIAAMKENTMFWIMYWYSSRRGGHYIFAPIGADAEAS